VRLWHGETVTVRHVVTGDSHRAQHAPTLHFGLGETARVDRAEVHWANGGQLVLEDLAADRYYDVRQ
jgi:hypothetical protein